MEDDRPVDQRTFYIKRCVAISGDTLEVRDGQVYSRWVASQKTCLET